MQRPETLGLQWLAENYDLDPRVVRAIEEMIVAEREACAKIAETIYGDKEHYPTIVGEDIAAAIRARSNPLT